MNSRIVRGIDAPLRIAVIGTGDVVRNWHIPAIKRIDQLELTAIMSKTPGRGEELANTHGIYRVYRDIQSLSADRDIDLVIVASRDGSHAAQAAALMKANKHLLIEKPLALNLREAEQLASIQRMSRGSYTAVGFHLRHHPAHLGIASSLLYENPGAIRRIELEWGFAAPPQDWRMRSDSADADWWAMGALGTHCLDLVHWITRAEAKHMKHTNVKISNEKFGGRDEEVDLTFTLSSPRGQATEVQIKLSMLEYRKRKFVVHCEKETYECTDTLGPRGGGTKVAHGHTITYQPQCPYEAQLRDLIRCILPGDEHTDPLATFEDGLENMKYLNHLSCLREQASET